MKRELETIYVHKFSNATMPAFNIFKNSGHYWILSGFNLAYFVYAPAKKLGLLKFFFHVNQLPTSFNNLLFALWVFAELSNLVTHLNLSGLRKEDTKNMLFLSVTVLIGFLVQTISLNPYLGLRMLC